MLGDLTKLRQILINLLGNAIKFTSEGSVSLNISSIDRGDETPQFLFEITDTGKGVDKLAQKKIFEGFLINEDYEE